MARGGELAHVEIDLRDDGLCGHTTDNGNHIEALDRIKGTGGGAVRVVTGALVHFRRLCGGPVAHQLLNAARECVDVGRQLTDPAEQQTEQIGVVPA